MSSKPSDTVSTISSNSTLKPSPAPKCEPKGCSLPDSPRAREIYLASRIVSCILGIGLIILAVIAKDVVDRPKWFSPILSPAINTICASGIDVFLILWTKKRAPRLQRLFHDGALGIGCGVAGGFLVAFTRNDIGGSSTERSVVAVLILVGIFAEMLIHLGIGLDAGLEWHSVRQDARRNTIPIYTV